MRLNRPITIGKSPHAHRSRSRVHSVPERLVGGGGGGLLPVPPLGLLLLLEAVDGDGAVDVGVPLGGGRGHVAQLARRPEVARLMQARTLADLRNGGKGLQICPQMTKCDS